MRLRWENTIGQYEALSFSDLLGELLAIDGNLTK